MDTKNTAESVICDIITQLSKQNNRVGLSVVLENLEVWDDLSPGLASYCREMIERSDSGVE